MHKKYHANEKAITASTHNMKALKFLFGFIFFSKNFDTRKTGTPRRIMGANIITTEFIKTVVVILIPAVS